MARFLTDDEWRDVQGLVRAARKAVALITISMDEGDESAILDGLEQAVGKVQDVVAAEQTAAPAPDPYALLTAITDAYARNDAQAVTAAIDAARAAVGEGR